MPSKSLNILAPHTHTLINMHLFINIVIYNIIERAHTHTQKAPL